MRQLGASEKRGRTPAALSGAAGPGSEPAHPVTGVHRRRSDARRRAVDELVATRVVTTAVGAGHARQPPHDSSVAEKTQGGPPHGTQEKDDGSPSRSQRAIRKHRPPATRL